MRVAAAVLIVTFALSFGDRSALARSGDDPALLSIRMIDALNGWAVAGQGDANALLRTTDGGTHWGKVSQDPFYVNATNVDIFSPFFAWIGASRTVDGGRTWKDDLAPAESIRSIDFINAREGWLVSCQGARVATSEVSVYRSTDGGDTWFKVVSSRFGMAENQFLQAAWGGELHVAFLNPMIGWIVRTDPQNWDDSSYFFATRDGGRTWRQQKLPRPPHLASLWGSGIMPPKFFTVRDGVLPALYANLDHRSYRPIAAWAVLYLTHDGGMTWTYATPVVIANRMWGVDYYGLARWGMSVSDFDHAWITDGNELFATNDGGRRWTTIRPGRHFSDVSRVDFVSSDVGWALRHERPFLLKTMDGGKTWAPIAYAVSGR